MVTYAVLKHTEYPFTISAQPHQLLTCLYSRRRLILPAVFAANPSNPKVLPHTSERACHGVSSSSQRDGTKCRRRRKRLNGLKYEVSVISIHQEAVYQASCIFHPALQVVPESSIDKHLHDSLDILMDDPSPVSEDNTLSRETTNLPIHSLPSGALTVSANDLIEC